MGTFVQGFTGALQNFADPQFWLWMMAGVVVGLILGIIAGVSGLTGIVLFLPFVFFAIVTARPVVSWRFFNNC